MPGKPLSIEGCTPLRNAEYYDFLQQQIASAKIRLWISMFTINATVGTDGDLRVRNVLKSLALAQRRGIDVRVLLGADEAVASDLLIANQVALRFLQVLGVSVRNYRSATSTNSHSKVVLIDDNWLMLGSHNWSPRSFSAGIDDSIAICSGPMAAKVRALFVDAWIASQPSAFHGPDAGAPSSLSDYSPGPVFRRNVLAAPDKLGSESPSARIVESMTGDLIAGRSYVERFEDLAEQAEKTIKVVQFYFSYDGRARTPPGALMAALEKAHRRGGFCRGAVGQRSQGRYLSLLRNQPESVPTSEANRDRCEVRPGGHRDTLEDRDCRSQADPDRQPQLDGKLVGTQRGAERAGELSGSWERLWR